MRKIICTVEYNLQIGDASNQLIIISLHLELDRPKPKDNIVYNKV